MIETLTAPAPVRTGTPSKYQRDIYDFVQYGHYGQHGVVDAVPGSGKTTTLIGAAKHVEGDNNLFVAFNKNIATEISNRLQRENLPMKAGTIHSTGYAALRAKHPRWEVDDRKYRNIIRDLLPLKQRDSVAPLANALTLSRITRTPLHTTDDLDRLCSRYTIELEPNAKSVEPDLEHALYTIKQALEDGDDLARERHIIDYADMICLPVEWDLPIPQHATVFVDECQDLNAAQLEFVLGCVAPNGRMLFVGDKHQCQPAGTMVRLADGTEKPIEQLISTVDSVVAFDRRSALFVKKGILTQTSSRHYEGKLYTIQAGNKQSRCTDSHKWLVRWCNNDQNAWVTYLMRQGNRYRVGMTKLFLKQNPKKGNFDFGLASRARQEQADAAWILKIHQNYADALVYEEIVAAKYGLPEVVFSESDGVKYYTQDMIDQIFDALQPLVQMRRALQCLEDHGRDLEYPIYARGKDHKQQRQGRTTLFETQACNLISGYMAIPVAPDTICSSDRLATWEPVNVTSEYFEGRVYSLNVDKYHKYVADGLVTCNSIYGFAGADTTSIPTIIQRVHASVLPLSICYRCPRSHVALAAELYPGIEPAPWAIPGEIRDITENQLYSQAQVGDMLLCRTTKPLIAACLNFIRAGIPARVRGRDIGAQLTGIVRHATRYMTATEWYTFPAALMQYEAVAIEAKTRRGASDLEIQSIRDRVLSVATVYEATYDRCHSVADLEREIVALFSDEQSGITLSTVHKAKGLEADHVYILHPELMPHPKARGGWEMEQERNIKYVALTRAKQSLSFVAMDAQ